jgi:hypothetical protein
MGMTIYSRAPYKTRNTFAVSADPTVLAYIAGIMDGEGSISRDSKGYWRVIVGMTDREVIDYLHSFGGTVHTHTRRVPPRKPLYHWTVRDRRSVSNLLEAILPYMQLTAKKELALQAIHDTR